MEQSAIREYDINEAAPDFASLHPGYDADLPDGLFGCLAVQPHLQKYFGFRLTQIRCISLTVPSHRGAYHDRHERGAGCGGRGSVGHVRGGRAGFKPVSDRTACGRETLFADGEVVWF